MHWLPCVCRPDAMQRFEIWNPPPGALPGRGTARLTAGDARRPDFRGMALISDAYLSRWRRRPQTGVPFEPVTAEGRGYSRSSASSGSIGRILRCSATGTGTPEVPSGAWPERVLLHAGTRSPAWRPDLKDRPVVGRGRDASYGPAPCGRHAAASTRRSRRGRSDLLFHTAVFPVIAGVRRSSAPLTSLPRSASTMRSSTALSTSTGGTWNAGARANLRPRPWPAVVAGRVCPGGANTCRQGGGAPRPRALRVAREEEF